MGALPRLALREPRLRRHASLVHSTPPRRFARVAAAGRGALAPAGTLGYHHLDAKPSRPLRVVGQCPERG